MSAFNRYGIYAASIGSIVLRDLSDLSYRTASNKSVIIPGGSVHPQAIVESHADPVLSFSTKAMGALFGGTPAVDPWVGYVVNVAGLSTAAAYFQFQKRADGSTFASGSNHVVGTSSKGFLCPTSLSASQDDPSGAKCMLDYYPLSTDGYTVPMSWSSASALTSSPTLQNIWYLGPAYVGSVGVSGTEKCSIQSLEVRFGIDYRSPRGCGNPYAVNGSVHAIIPEIRAVFLDLAVDSRILAYPHGAPVTSGSNSWQFFLQKGSAGGSRVAAATAEHMSIICVTGSQTTDSISVREIDDAQTEVILRPTAGLYVTPNVAIQA